MNSFHYQKKSIFKKNKAVNITIMSIMLAMALCFLIKAIVLPVSAETNRSIHLACGLNIVGYPLKVPQGYTSDKLIVKLGSKDEVIKIQKYDPYTNTFITTMYNQEGKPCGGCFIIMEGEGYLVYMKDSNTVDFKGTPVTSEIFCKEGLNIISIPNITSGYTSYDLLSYLGNPNEIMYLKGLNTETGTFDTTVYYFGKPSGSKFDIKDNQGYLVYMKKPKVIATKGISDPNCYTIETVTAPFIALPNIVQITEEPNEINSSSFCYGCHNGREDNRWTKVGALPIFGDDVGEKRKEHHPMGSQASLKDRSKAPNGIFVRAPGTKPELLNRNQEITCTSCHDDFHGPGPYKDQPDAKKKNKENHFLRWQFVKDNTPQSTDSSEDSASFCIECHSDKNNLSGKHLQNRDTDPAFAHNIQRILYAYDSNSGIVEKKVECANCMFCHFIHDGEERQSCNPDQSTDALLIWPDVDSLIRVSPLPLSWGEQYGDSDSLDYEDLCYGCHGEKEIVGNTGKEGSRLDPEHYYTHPFLVQPSFIFDPNFPISDGKGINVRDDYGVNTGYMYCGTCHDVHDNRATPYLTPIPSPSGGYKSPYNFKDKGFCEACHDRDGFVAKSHPVGVDPNPDPTKGRPTKDKFTDFYTANPAFEYLFNQGGSGGPGGITAPYDVDNSESTDGSKGKIICLTCHNTHAAATSWEGKTKNDPVYKNHGILLVNDNMKTRGTQSPGSDLCKACHPFAENDKFPTGDHGAGTLSGAESGICNACHTPHNSAGPKLWSREGYGSGPFQGERQLCFTCHNKRGIGNTGRETVFKGIGLGDPIPVKYLEDHVMRQWADIKKENVFVDQNCFPLDPNDTDVIPDPNDCKPCNPNTDGFYCGSCHNPHLQKGERYLRGIGDIGYPLNRKGFCKQCHISFKNCPGGEGECLECHHPHKGKTMICKDPDIGSKIYFNEISRGEP